MFTHTPEVSVSVADKPFVADQQKFNPASTAPAPYLKLEGADSALEANLNESLAAANVFLAKEGALTLEDGAHFARQLLIAAGDTLDHLASTMIAYEHPAEFVSTAEEMLHEVEGMPFPPSDDAIRLRRRRAPLKINQYRQSPDR